MAEEIVFKLEVDTSEAVGTLDKVESGVKDVGTSAKKAAKGTKAFGTTLKNLGKAAGIVGLLVTAFEILKETLFSNQAVVDAMNTATTALKIVFNDLWKFVTDDLTPALASVFEAPQKALEAVKNGIQEFVDRQLKLLFDGLGLLGKAFDKLLTGDIKGALADAGEGFVEIQRAINPLVIVTEAVVKGTIAATEAIVDYAAETYNAADAITEQTKATANLELQQTRIREKADRDAEQQRQIRDDITKGIDERIEANQRLAEILNKQQEDEQNSVKQRIANLQQEQELLGFKQERYDEIYALETELIAIEAQQAGFRSEQLINENALIQEKIDLQGFQTQAELENNQIKLDDAIRVEKELDDIIKGLDKLNDDDAKKTEDRDKKVADNKIALANSAANAIIDLAGESSAVGKLAAVGQAVINTYQGITAALAQTTDVTPTQTLRFANAAAVGIAGALNVKKILATKTVGNKGGGGSAPTISATAPTAPPEFNVEQTNQNQLADTIGGQLNNSPTKAYVVGSDVTTQQEFDRVQLNNATL
jgi:hypothetical protein